MRAQSFVLGLAACLLCLSSAWAILIETKGGPVGGYLQSDDGKILTVKVRLPDGTEKTHEFERSKVKIIHQLDRARLEKLTRDNPKDYRDYAEELAQHKEDPEARDTAMRLYLIAAYLDPKQFGASSLLGMSALAGSPAEARKCRAMAFLLDPKEDAGFLKTESAKPAQLPKGQVAGLKEFLKSLQLYRAGKIKEATGAARREGLDKIFAMAPGMVDQKTFLQRCSEATCPTCKLLGKIKCNMCTKGLMRNPFGQQVKCTTCNGTGAIVCSACEGTGINPIPDDVLRVMLRAELWAVDQLAGFTPRSKKEPEAAWSTILEARQLSPVVPLSLETITEFDPHKCLYRDGKWVAPRP
jgi:hypothetical protein